MADDITLTVRVRDMTRGDFNQIRQRMRGMGGDIRRIARDADGASGSSDRFANSLTGLQRRLSQFQRTGSLARHEMDHMRRSMGLLGRDLRGAAADGELTEDQFRDLRRELERTRLDFDHLDNALRRQDAMAQRRARNAAERHREAERLRREAMRAAARQQREAERLRREERRRQEGDARAIVADRQRMARAHAAALRQQAQRDLAAQRVADQMQREERRRQEALGRSIVAARQRITRAHAAGLREQAQREREARRRQEDLARRIVSERQRMARAHAAGLREQAQRERQAEAERRRLAAAATAAQLRDVNRLAALGGPDAGRPVPARVQRARMDDQGLTLRFRALGMRDMDRMTRGFANLQRSMDGVTGSNDRARRSVRALGGDLRTMARALQDAQSSGSLARRDFNALTNGLNMTVRSARLLRRSGDLTGSSFRDMQREVAGLRAQLVLLGNEGTRIRRLDAHLLLLQRRMRDTGNSAGSMRRSVSRMGEGMVGGLRGGLLATAGLAAMFGKLTSRIKMSKRWTAILIAVLLLIGPIAQALGALLVAALGGAFIALGVLALKNSTLVKSAFQDMKNTVASTMREAAQPMEEDLVAGIQNIGIAVARMKPILTAAFTATGPLIDDFVGAFTDLAGMSMPGILTALREMGPAMEGFRTAMGLVGQGFGDMFAAMTADGGAEALRDVWITLGRELANLLVGIGEFIRFAAQSGTATMILVGVFRTLSGILNIVQAGLATIDAVFGDLFRNINENTEAFRGLDDGVGKFGDSFVAAGQSVGSLKKQLKDVNKEIKRIESERSGLEDKQLWGGLDAGDEYSLRRTGSDEDSLNAVQAQRKALLAAIAQAEGEAAGQTSKHAAAVSDLIAKISNLNDINRSNLDARSNQERVINEATKEYKKYSDALKYSKGQLDLTTESSQKAYGWLSQIASATKESTDAAIKSNAPWKQVQEQWKHGYDQVVKLGDGMGLTKEQARTLADQIVGIPNKEIFLQARTEQAKADFDSVIAAMKAAPNEKTITVKALTADSITTLEKMGFIVEQLPDGSFTVTAKTGTAIENIGKVKGARNALKGKNITMSAKDASSGVIQAIKDLIATLQDRTVTITTRRVTVFESFTNPGNTAGSLADAIRRQAERARGGATGGMAGNLQGLAVGGSVAGGVLKGPGTKKSDSLVARLSRGEFVMRASAVDRYGPSFMSMINEGRLPLPGFHKGGYVTKKEKEARNAARGQLTISHFGRKAGYKNAEVVNDFGMADSLKELVGSLNRWRGVIKRATHGGTEKRLLSSLDKAGKSLIKYQKQHDKISKTLEKARNLRNTVSDRLKGEAGIVKGANAEDSRVTINTLLSNMTGSAANTKQFSGMLDQLKKKGLSGGLIKQIAEAGIEGGGMETAAAILGGGKGEIKRLNDLQKQIDKYAKAAGNKAADAMYGAGLKAGEGVIAGLEKKQKSIEKAMMKIAKSMEKAIKKALGIKSPSKVMEEIGDYTAEGFSVGMRKNRSVTPAWESMLGTPGGGTGRGGAGGHGGRPVVVHNTITMDGQVVARQIFDPFRAEIAHRGGNVQQSLGRG